MQKTQHQYVVIGSFPPRRPTPEPKKHRANTTVSNAAATASASPATRGPQASRAVETRPSSFPAEPAPYAAEEARAKLVAMISEELRSPLAAIVSAAKIMKEHHGSKPELVDRFGGAIICEGERVIELLDTYLDLTAMRFGHDSWKDRDIDVATLIALVLSTVEEHARVRKVQLVESVDQNLPTLHVDPDRLSQVLTGLIHNAIDGTRSGGSITVRAELSDGEIVLAVDDTGNGMHAHAVETAFERNVRLCVAREIVQHYDGRIWAESEPGHGSTFAAALPVSPAN